MKKPFTKHIEIKFTEETFLRFVQGDCFAYEHMGQMLFFYPPHYQKKNEDYKRGFEDGVKCQKAGQKFADKMFSTPES